MRLAYIGCEVMAREFFLLAAQADTILDPILMPFGLHSYPAELRKRVQAEIDRVEGLTPSEDEKDYQPQHQAILLGYALCSNGIMGLTSRRLPLVAPRGHDCVTLLLGSKERYRDYFDTHRGIYWYSAGWIQRTLQPGRARWELTHHAYVEKYGEENADYLMEMEQSWYKEYQWATYINWNLPTAEQDRAYTRDCAEFLGWQYDELQGDTRLMRDFLNGQWDHERFLVTEPGQFIEPSYDAGIVHTCATCPNCDVAAPVSASNVLRR
jgi:hypothetical protein